MRNNSMLPKYFAKILILIGISSEGFSQAILPAAWGFDDAAPIGWSESLGAGNTRYTNGYIGQACRMDAAGDFVLLEIGEDPGLLLYWLKGQNAGGAWQGTFTLQESTDGINYTSLRTLIGSELPSTQYTMFTDQPAPTTRFIRWFYTEKVSGHNLALDNVICESPAANDEQEINVVQASSGSLFVIADAPSTTFTIQNLGLSNSLIIDYIQIGGLNANEFSITGVPAMIPASSEDNFDLNFNPNGTGVRYCTISIGNNDQTENPYVINIASVEENLGGCLDFYACNYNPNAAYDDGSCFYQGCTELGSCNYNPNAGCDDGSCIPSGCIDPSACNFNPNAGCDDGTCSDIGGCNDPLAYNYNPTDVCSNECCYEGCMDEASCNFNPNACVDDGSCIALGSACNDDNPNTLQDVYHEFCECYGMNSSAICGDDIFISEYVEGLLNNKAIELYNPTSEAILLDGHYSIGRDRNGAGLPMLMPITGIIPSHGTRVFVLDKRDPNGTGNEVPVSEELQALADTFLNPVYVQVYSPMYFTGDDAFVLAKDGQILDVVGKIGEDPGDGWFALNDPLMELWTLNHTMVRRPTVVSGSVLDIFDPSLEWNLLPTDDFSHLGWHETICVNLIFGCPDPSACNYNSSTDVNDGSCVFSGCTDINACNFDSQAGCDDGTCLFLNQSCTDNNSNTMMDGIDANCTCTGIPFNYGFISSSSVSLCPGVGANALILTPPLNILDYTLQWYYRDGEFICPFGLSTEEWIPIDGANALAYTPSEFTGTRTFACFLSPSSNYNIPSQWVPGCIVINYNEFDAQAILGNPNIAPFSPETYAVNPIPGNSFNWNVTNGSITSGQGTSVIEVLWGQNGPYQVTLTESNGTCNDISTLLVVNNNCTSAVIAMAENPAGFCPGESNILTAATDATGITYQWYLDGSPFTGGTNQTLEVTQGGNYQVVITSGTCTAASQILTVNELPAVVVPDINILSSNPGCSGGSVILSIDDTNLSGIIWSTGETTASIEVVASGDYSAGLTNTDGCQATAGPIAVNLSLTETLPICLVTVDPQSGNNQVIWEPLMSDVIDAYAVYKETNAADVYELAGTVLYGQDGLFTDFNSNSAVQASRYKLAIIDSCNIESMRSTLHKTIHLTSNVGLNNTVNLIWSSYEGFSFASYNIYRGTDISAMSLLATVASNLNSYTDLAPLGSNAFYLIEVVGVSCDPTRSEVSSTSNVIQNTLISVNESDTSNFIIYPNPAHDFVVIQCTANLMGQEYVLFDLVGRTLQSGKLSALKTHLNIGELAKGNYIIQIGLAFQKLVIH